MSADVKRIPFDLAPDRVLPHLIDGAGRPADPVRDREALVKALVAARKATIDSPVFQLIGDPPRPEIDRLKTDLFRDEAAYSAAAKERPAAARSEGAEARAVESDLGPLEDVEAGVPVDLPRQPGHREPGRAGLHGDLVSDASGQLRDDEDPKRRLVKVLTRSDSVLMKRVRGAQYGELAGVVLRQRTGRISASCMLCQRVSPTEIPPPLNASPLCWSEQAKHGHQRRREPR